jgi:hypothetical protein
MWSDQESTVVRTKWRNAPVCTRERRCVTVAPESTGYRRRAKKFTSRYQSVRIACSRIRRVQVVGPKQRSTFMYTGKRLQIGAPVG